MNLRRGGGGYEGSQGGSWGAVIPTKYGRGKYGSISEEATS